MTGMLSGHVVGPVHFIKGSCSLELQSDGGLLQRRLYGDDGLELSVLTKTDNNSSDVWNLGMFSLRQENVSF